MKEKKEMKVAFVNGYGVLHIAYAGKYDFVRPIVVATTLEALEKEVREYLLRVKPLFPITEGTNLGEVISLVSDYSLLAIREGKIFFNFDELRLESWYLITAGGGEELKSTFVSFIESDHEWCKNELSDVRERLKSFALSLGSDWLLLEEEQE